jgi:hypothetical protein
MLVGDMLWSWQAQGGFGESAAGDVYVGCIWLVGLIVAVMEAFQHLKRSTDVLKPVACSGNTFLSEVADSGYSRTDFHVLAPSLHFGSMR